jgi:GTP-binding protein
MAKVSSAPGKTRLLNFFDINHNSFRLVDAPGYGYAKISRDLKRSFQEMMEDYLTSRANLKFVTMLVDLRHKPSADDLLMYQFLKAHRIDVVVIGTKLDKLKQNEIKKNEQMIRQTLSLNAEDSFILTSSANKKNLDLIDQEFKKRINY